MDGKWERGILFGCFGCFASCCCFSVFPPFLLLPLSLSLIVGVSRSRGLSSGSPLGFSVRDRGGGFVWVLLYSVWDGQAALWGVS